jgi:hypothetical protein
MVLNEAPSERIQQTWYSRLARERRELSVSVGETLVNTPREGSFWLDDQSQHATAVGTGKSNNVFPPRLSLQSRALPGVPSHVGTGLVNRQSNTVPHTNIWTRFVRRLRSSLSAFKSHSSVVTTPALSPCENVAMQSAQVEDVLYPSSGTGDSSNHQVLSADEVSSKNERRVVPGSDVGYGALRSTPGRQRLGGRTTRIRLEAMPTPSAEGIPGKERDYLGPKSIARPPCEDPPSHAMGIQAHPHAVRAATLPYPAQGETDRPHIVGVAAGWGLPPSSPCPAASHAYSAVPRAPMTFPDTAPFSKQNGPSVGLPAIEEGSGRPVGTRAFMDGDGGTTSVRLPAIEKVTRRPVEARAFMDGDGETTSIRLPAIERGAGRRREPAPAWQAGTGRFECGQRDVTISHPSVTASSVVLVTLTANPGPVVVQYVSLQPGRGFTLHLTAPTPIGAPFNYVVFGVS